MSRTDNNLPLPLTGLVGREREITEVKERLDDHRLLTLTGSGGSGKTRLALAVALEVVEGYGDGVWLVELASLSDPELVPQAVASVVGVREAPGTPLVDSLCFHLGSREVLLVLDNCEHLVGACASLAEPLLHSCPNLRILGDQPRGARRLRRVPLRRPSSVPAGPTSPSGSGELVMLRGRQALRRAGTGGQA